MLLRMYIHSFELYAICASKEVSGVLMEVIITTVKVQKKNKRTNHFSKNQTFKIFFLKAEYKPRDHQWCFCILKENTGGIPDFKKSFSVSLAAC